LADALKKSFGVQAALIEGSGGVFDVHLDEKQIWSKHDVGRFPENDEILKQVQALSSKPR
jgi:selT/selW/selH-like putative selenoprotein